MKESKIVCIDCEYDNQLAWKASNIWCIVAYDLSTKKTHKFFPKSPTGNHEDFKEEFVEFFKNYDKFIGHNFWGAEAIVFERLLGIHIDDTMSVIDTLVWSRLLRPSSPPAEKLALFAKKGWDNRLGNHSLEAWGHRLGFAKDTFDDFSRHSTELLNRCERDVELNVKVYERLLKEKEEFGFPDLPFEIEQKVHRILQSQMINGFTLDKVQAIKLRKETDELLEGYLHSLNDLFPPKKVLLEVYKPKLTKAGELPVAARKKLLKSIHEANPDGSYSIYEMKSFNADSPAQIADRLLDLGWKPRKYTAKGQPSTSKENLEEAIDALSSEYPQVEALRKYSVVKDKNEKARKWLELAEEDGKVHGKINHIGPWTHRCSHYDDNMANITKVKISDGTKEPVKGLEGNFGYESRACWVPRKGWKLVGCDAAGIQLRALAHYMEDKEYIKEVTEGDVHVTNQKAAGIERGYGSMSARDVAKRFIYSWLLGAGDEKTGLVVGLDRTEQDHWISEGSRIKMHNYYVTERGSKDNLVWFIYKKLERSDRMPDKETVARIIKGHLTKKRFLENTPALKRFKEEAIRQAARDGFMIGLDGRKIWVPSEHLAMGAFLQGFEAVIMKLAMVLAYEELVAKGIPFALCAFVHDEFQWEAPGEYAELVGKTLAESIKKAGEKLCSKCPLEGSYKVSDSWAGTH